MSFAATVKLVLKKIRSGILECKRMRDHELIKTGAIDFRLFKSRVKQLILRKFKHYLTEMDISFVVDPTLVRGLDYYNHTAFEIMSNAEGFGAI